MIQSRSVSRRVSGAALFTGAAMASACTATVGPYIRNIEVRSDGVVLVERCTSVVTDYGFVATVDNDVAWCDQNVLPLQGQQPKAVYSQPVASAPIAPSPQPVTTQAPPPSASPAQVVTPAGMAPGMASPSPSAPVTSGPCPQGMALLTGGSYNMGDRKDRVKVGQFCMDLTEVTADAYAACVRLGQCSTDGLSCGPASTYGVVNKGSHPINCVDWSQASAYCGGQGKRLPTEEEWEWAARGGTAGKSFPWGNVEPSSQVCWSGYGQLTGTCQVGTYPSGATPQGLLDLSGNVWEWTSGRKDASSAERVARGGAWSSSASSYLRAAERYWTSPTYRFIYIGFRCVK